MNIKEIIKRLSSLQTALLLLSLLFILVIVGTLAQVEMGIYYASKLFFSAFLIYWPISDSINIPIFPGGLSIGIALLISMTLNLITRIPLKKQNIGIWLIHSGIILLLLGAGLTTALSTESQLILKEGETRYYSEDFHKNELVLIDSRNPNQQTEFVIDSAELKNAKRISIPSLNCSIVIEQFFPNSNLLKSSSTPDFNSSLITALDIKPLPIVTQDKFKNIPSAIIHIEKGNLSQRLLVSSGINAATKVTVLDPGYIIVMRQTRYYNDTGITLKDFQRELYEGSDIPKSFRSIVEMSKEGKVLSNAEIYMNHPLRLNGKTYYQASFGENDTVSVLQVVENPSWPIPYIACFVTSLGLILHPLLRKKRL